MYCKVHPPKHEKGKSTNLSSAHKSVNDRIKGLFVVFTNYKNTPNLHVLIFYITESNTKYPIFALEIFKAYDKQYVVLRILYGGLWFAVCDYVLSVLIYPSSF